MRFGGVKKPRTMVFGSVGVDRARYWIFFGVYRNDSVGSMILGVVGRVSDLFLGHQLDKAHKVFQVETKCKTKNAISKVSRPGYAQGHLSLPGFMN